MRSKYKFIAEEACELIINEDSNNPNYLAINGYANHAICMLEKYEFNLEHKVVKSFINAKNEINKICEVTRWDRRLEYYAFIELVATAKELPKILKQSRRFSNDDIEGV